MIGVKRLIGRLLFFLFLVVKIQSFCAPYVDSQKVVWSLQGGSLVGVDLTSNKRKEIDLGVNARTYFLLSEDANNNLWVAGTQGVLVMRSDTMGAIGYEDGLLCKEIICNYKDSHQTLWIGTRKGLFSFNPLFKNTIELISATKNLQINSVIGYGDDIWVVLPDQSIKKVFSYPDESWKAIFYRVFGLVLLVIFVFYFIYASKRVNKDQIAMMNLEQQMLLQQMNPHFLFNALSAIYQHILSQNSPEVSALFLQKYSALMRLYLESSRRKLITINTEITCLDHYLSLEQFRSENAFTYSINLEPVVFGEVEIPPFFIQPIVENAIWHGLLPKGKGGVLLIEFKITKDLVTVSITDNGVGRKNSIPAAGKSTSGHAIKIIKERIQLENKFSSKNHKFYFNLEDLMDAAGNQAGTKVILHFPVHLT